LGLLVRASLHAWRDEGCRRRRHHTFVDNAVGYPAGIVPVTRVRQNEESERPETKDIVQKVATRCEEGSAGLPIGVQIAARPWREDQVLAAMRIVQEAARAEPDSSLAATQLIPLPVPRGPVVLRRAGDRGRDPLSGNGEMGLSGDGAEPT
jgi:hypothetical protein